MRTTLTISEAMTRAGRPYGTIINWIHYGRMSCGRLPATKVGAVWLIEAADLDAYVLKTRGSWSRRRTTAELRARPAGVTE